MSRWLRVADANIKYIVNFEWFDPYKGTRRDYKYFNTLQEAWDFYKECTKNDHMWEGGPGGFSYSSTSKPRMISIFEIDQTGKHTELASESLQKDDDLDQYDKEKMETIKLKNRIKRYNPKPTEIELDAKSKKVVLPSGKDLELSWYDDVYFYQDPNPKSGYAVRLENGRTYSGRKTYSYKFFFKL